MPRGRRLWNLLIVAAMLPSLSHAQPAPEPQGQFSDGRVRYFQQFSGETVLKTGEPVHVDIRVWIVVGGTELERLPMDRSGLMIVQLRGGELQTMIAGERREWREDDFWTVPRGARMALATEDDSAIFQTIVISER